MVQNNHTNKNVAFRSQTIQVNYNPITKTSQSNKSSEVIKPDVTNMLMQSFFAKEATERMNFT